MNETTFRFSTRAEYEDAIVSEIAAVSRHANAPRVTEYDALVDEYVSFCSGSA